MSFFKSLKQRFQKEGVMFKVLTLVSTTLLLGGLIGWFSHDLVSAYVPRSTHTVCAGAYLLD